MIEQGSLFDVAAYPDHPGFKAQATSREAAIGMAPKAATLRDRVLAALRERPGTPEQVAKRIGEPVMNCRPRFSELLKKRLIRDTGHRGKAMGGKSAIVWEAVQ